MLSIVYAVITKLNSKPANSQQVNLKIKKDEAKVVDTLDIEDLGSKSVMCRCWKSNRFPYCDGSHVKHNECNNDNVGPLILTKKAN